MYIAQSTYVHSCICYVCMDILLLTVVSVSTYTFFSCRCIGSLEAQAQTALFEDNTNTVSNESENGKKSSDMHVCM